MATLIEKAKANPIVSVATVFILLVTTVTSTLTATGQLDSLIMTQAEHEADFVPLSESVGEIRAWNKCDRLERRIIDLEDRKWKYQQAGAIEDIIRDIDKQIRSTQREYDALSCAQVLAQ